MKEVNEVEMQELSLTISHDSAKASRQRRLSRLIAAADWALAPPPVTNHSLHFTSSIHLETERPARSTPLLTPKYSQMTR